MATEIIDGIIIKASDYEDYAQIITFFARQVGKMVIYAPGVRKFESKNKYSTQLFSESTFEIFKSTKLNAMSKLKTGTLIKEHIKIAKDYNGYLYIQAISDIIDNLTEPQLPDIDTYNILQISLNNIENSVNKFATYIFALFYLTKISGNKLLLDRCVRCRKHYRWYRRFDYKTLGLICLNCILPNENIQSQTFVDIFVKMSELDYQEILTFNFNFIDLIALHNFIIDYYENDIGIWINSFNELKGTAALKIPENNINDYL